MRYNLLILFVFTFSQINAQIKVEKFDLNIASDLPDTLQIIYEEFLNNNVEKISIVKLKKKYNHIDYYYFLKNKKFFQSRKKWIKNNSFEESIIREGESFPFKHFDSIVFEKKFLGVDKEFIESEYFLDSTERKLTLKEMFNGEKPELVNMCYIPRHAVLFYDHEDRVTGIYEICFECGKVKIGIVGTRMFSKFSPYIKSLFKKYKDEL